MNHDIESRVDMARLMDLSGDDRDFVEVLLRGFINDVENRILKIEASLDQGDREAWKKEAHAMRGAAVNLGCDAIRDVTNDIENDARSGDADFVREKLVKLKVEFGITREAINSWTD